MSRALKFRAWYQGKMYPVQKMEVVQTFAHYTEEMDVVMLVDVSTGSSQAVSVREVTLQQFTGRHDKSGNEIYEELP